MMGFFPILTFDSELQDEEATFLQHCISSEILKGNAFGIAKQAVDRGNHSLTSRQRYVLNEVLAHAVGDLVCETCGDRILLQDAIDENCEFATRCQSCEFDWQKLARS